MPAPDAIIRLVQTFEQHRDQYRKSDFSETATRHQFIDPLFMALGWDVNNTAGNAEQYKDVVHEDKIKVGGATKAPDYSFRIGKERKFFVEAKKPSVDIAHDVEPAYQLRRYAWSAKLPVSILTDFEELSVYECRSKPDQRDKASTGRVLQLKYTQYVDKWDELAGLFSKQAVWQGALDKFAEAKTGKRGTAEVDDDFLSLIETWREDLAKNLVLRNPALTGRAVNWAVQQIIDRIVFLRICEARDLETFEQLRALLNGGSTYARLQELFRRADDRYNSGLFHFHHDKDQSEAPDTLTPALTIDDKVLKELIGKLYFPDSPYEFSVLPADILGHVYERFLGKVIRVTAGRQVKVEEKPEVRKAGGVFYTPTYIVDAIVAETVGPLLAGKAPGPTGGAAKLRILDPACGSGSFLLGAYQYLLDWHLDQYRLDPERWLKGKRPAIEPATGAADYRLTVDERKRILMNNLYGVDIDPQAVEVTKLSLLLKVLEGEAAKAQLSFQFERVLPDLGRNIKCGNSLIGPDFYDGKLDLPDDDTARRVNAFDWRAEFPEALAPSPAGAGGFDAVIGNPPYIRPHNLDAEDKQYFWRHYPTFVGKSDIYTCFIEQSVRLLRPSGYLGLIVSNGWLRLDSSEQLRRFLLQQTHVRRLIDFTGDVFKDAKVTTVLVFLQKSAPSEDATVEVAVTAPNTDLHMLAFKPIPLSAFEKGYKSIFDLSIDPIGEAIKAKIRQVGKPLSSLFDLSFGLKTGDDEKFLSRNPTTTDYKRLLRGADIHRYWLRFDEEYVWYRPELMTAHRKTARPGKASRFEQPKVLVRDTGGGLHGTYDNQNYYVKDVIIVSDRERNAAHLKYLIGILNSRVMRYYYETSFPTLHVQRDELASLPIRPIDFTNPADVARHDRMVALVTQMLDLRSRLAAEPLPHEQAALQRRIDLTDRQIDALVYELYGLSAAEVAGIGN